ncbi:head-tail connector protein [Brevundimonas diminuta]|uniref:head-tail connector protein n=1 Tax=Brevundimonas diminuta TaxID=293 RepID=UPI003D9A61B1
MSAPVSLTEAKLFLRVEHEAEDGLIQTLIDAAKARVEGEVGLSSDVDLCGAAEAGGDDAGDARL